MNTFYSSLLAFGLNPSILSSIKYINESMCYLHITSNHFDALTEIPRPDLSPYLSDEMSDDVKQ